MRSNFVFSLVFMLTLKTIFLSVRKALVKRNSTNGFIYFSFPLRHRTLNYGEVLVKKDNVK